MTTREHRRLDRRPDRRPDGQRPRPSKGNQTISLHRRSCICKLSSNAMHVLYNNIKHVLFILLLLLIVSLYLPETTFLRDMHTRHKICHRTGQKPKTSNINKYNKVTTRCNRDPSPPAASCLVRLGRPGRLADARPRGDGGPRDPGGVDIVFPWLVCCTIPLHGLGRVA